MMTIICAVFFPIILLLCMLMLGVCTCVATNCIHSTYNTSLALCLFVESLAETF